MFYKVVYITFYWYLLQKLLLVIIISDFKAQSYKKSYQLELA